jgi:transposase
MRTQHETNALERSNKMNRTQPCITIDVSKGSSHVCGFTEATVPCGKVKKIHHDKEGFQQIETLYYHLSRLTEKTPIIVYESTGIYHRGLRFFLEEMKLDFIEVSPLLSAKHRKNSSIRSAKTDVRDTYALSRLFYDVEFQLNQPIQEVYYQLQQLHRHYSSMVQLSIKCKVHFNEKLDILFPSFRTEIDDQVYNSYYLDLLKQYPHPKILMFKRVDVIERNLRENGIQKSRARSMAERIKNYCKNCYPGSLENSVDTLIFVKLIEQIQMYQAEKERISKKMIAYVNHLPLYRQLQSIPGIGPALASYLMSELGDLSRFEHHKQLLAYAGLDPIVSQSGKISGEGLKISKKGNKHLRRLLYQVVVMGVKSRFDHPIKAFYVKKKQTRSPKSAYIASCDKLLRIIFRMSQTGELYKI